MAAEVVLLLGKVSHHAALIFSGKYLEHCSEAHVCFL